jgi:hypothetical protein
MSNHWHGVATDPAGRIPEFLERFHRLLARAQNALLERSENLWSSEKTSVVYLVSDDDVLDKMAYTIANPTSAGLVRSPHEWPGVVTTRIGERHVVRKPAIFFDPNGDLPDMVAVEMVPPPIFDGLDSQSLALRLAAGVEQLVRQARASLLHRGTKFLGAMRVLQQPVTAIPTTPRRRTPNPRIAARDWAARVAALRGLASFWRAYRQALNAWRSGVRDVIFPIGTYAMRIHARVACAPACPS